MRLISVQDLGKLVTSQLSVNLVDVRTRLEFTEVHIHQAVNVPLDEIDSSLLLKDSSTKQSEIYLICRSGGRASQAAQQLVALGYTAPVVVEGGLLAWIEAGLAVERSPVKRMSLERQIRIVAGSVIIIGGTLSFFLHPAFQGLTLFVGAGLLFSGITDWCGMGLILAKMPWNKRST